MRIADIISKDIVFEVSHSILQISEAIGSVIIYVYKYTVIFSKEEIEKMASDPKYYAEKMHSIEGALRMSDEINAQKIWKCLRTSRRLRVMVQAVDSLYMEERCNDEEAIYYLSHDDFDRWKN